MMQESHEIYSIGGTKLKCVSWQGTGPVKAVLFIVHGLGEHSGRYEEMAKKFAENQLAVFAFDHRGHGHSDGKKGHASSIDQLLADVEQALMKCRSLYLDIPIVIFGHSMGGQIAATFVQKMKSKELVGGILSSSWFELVSPPPTWQLGLINGLKRIVPRLALSNGLDEKLISSVKSEVEQYKNDPLIHDRISFSLFKSIYRNGLRILAEKKQVKVPILVCHGDADEITSFDGTKKYAEIQGENATFKRWSGSFHEPHHDKDKDEVIRFYIEWIFGMIGKSSE